MFQMYSSYRAAWAAPNRDATPSASAGPVVRIPEPQGQDGLAGKCRYIGSPYASMARPTISQAGIDWWMGFFPSTESTEVDVQVVLFDPSTADWETFSGKLQRPVLAPQARLSAKNIFEGFAVMITDLARL